MKTVNGLSVMISEAISFCDGKEGLEDIQMQLIQIASELPIPQRRSNRKKLEIDFGGCFTP